MNNIVLQNNYEYQSFLESERHYASVEVLSPAETDAVEPSWEAPAAMAPDGATGGSSAKKKRSGLRPSLRRVPRHQAQTEVRRWDCGSSFAVDV